MNRTILACILGISMTAAAAQANAAAPEGKTTNTQGLIPLTVIAPSTTPKHAFVCPPGETCAEAKDARDKARGFSSPEFLKKQQKPVCMAIRGTGAYCTIDGMCYDASGKTDGVNYKKKAKETFAKKFSIPMPVMTAKAKGRGFSADAKAAQGTVVTGARGYVPYMNVIDESNGGEGRGMRGYGSEKKDRQPVIMVDLESSAYVLVANLQENPTSVYINDQYYGNIAPGVYATYLVQSGPTTVSIVNEYGEEMSETVDMPAGELVYYMVGPYEEPPVDEKGYGGSGDTWTPTWYTGGGGGGYWAHPAR